MPVDDLPNEGVVAELGRRLAAYRIARSWNQEELAQRAGVGRSTVQRIERGDSIQLLSLVKLLRALDRLAGVDALLAAQVRSPVADLERESAHRRRARVRRRRDETAPDEPQRPWTWGDEP
jgi:transcriptional regulator with XRE-family HTH domain